jgi:hypothetical protein
MALLAAATVGAGSGLGESKAPPLGLLSPLRVGTALIVGSTG